MVGSRQQHDAALPPGTTGVIRIDLDQLAANWRVLAALGRPAECAAVVKADAYGLGAIRCVPALATAGCATFFVARLGEAIEVRALAPDAVIYVLDGLLPGAEQEYSRIRARPVLSSLEEVQALAAFGRATGTRPAAALHVCSGLNRLGLPKADVLSLSQEPGLWAQIDLQLIMSHLASADAADDPKNAQQLETFQLLRSKLPVTPASLAASDGMMLGPAFYCDLMRPGYALYGGQPSGSQRTPVEPVVTVHARVLQVRDVAVGASVGYSGIWNAARPSRIAIIAAGYADGIPRSGSASNGCENGAVAFGGILSPVVGRISMDLITVDVTDLEPGSCQSGDWAELIGPTITLEEAGRRAGTIGYEILTRLGPRFQRIYVGGG
ncbi:MAG: alanine racemase [Hyphomicrobium sp.]|nr:alanine racemase [Hyphomicrobium sp.]PPC83260.1 MAG: alanine racemase [Hyphomicrobium sp.]